MSKLFLSNTNQTLSTNKHLQLIEWSENFTIQTNYITSQLKFGKIKLIFEDDLKKYFSLCALARSKSANQELRWIADSKLFKTRVSLEKSIHRTFDSAPYDSESKIKCVLSNNFFGNSKKQGVSLRLPLESCKPTKLCGNACYAHDVLDATPAAIIRGAINGWLAKTFEFGAEDLKKNILAKLTPHVYLAIRNAKKELNNLPPGFKRRPFIRFSHVGEIVNYPNFANALAKLVRDESNRKVDCIVYTRHKNAKKLDPSLWVINFTLDPVSHKRLKWAPDSARIVYSAFGGNISDIADVNFLEHHRHSHSQVNSGKGRICPATKPDTTFRTCDACLCNRCFVPVVNNSKNKVFSNK